MKMKMMVNEDEKIIKDNNEIHSIENNDDDDDNDDDGVSAVQLFDSTALGGLTYL